MLTLWHSSKQPITEKYKGLSLFMLINSRPKNPKPNLQKKYTKMLFL